MRGNFISLKIKKTKGTHPRIGFVVGQKIAKKATARNRIKRLLREAVRGYMEKIKGGVGIVMMPTPDICGKKLEEIKKEAQEVFKRAGL